jgi:predicted acetyltransferase
MADPTRIERLAPGEELAFTQATVRNFHEDETDEEAARWVDSVARDDFRAWVARRGDERIVGTLGVFGTSMSLPGGQLVPTAGITAVGVSQTHRRRGLLRRLMTACLVEAAERREPVAVLYASEGAIYGRFGFGPSGPHVRYRIERSAARFRDPVDPTVVVDATPEEAMAAFPPVFEELRRSRPCVGTDDDRWRMAVVDDPPAARGGASGRRLVHVPGRGYATYRIRNAEQDGLPAATVEVESLVATDPEADVALWQHVCDIDLTRTIVASRRPPDDALPMSLTDPVQARAAVDHAVYTRILDVPAALTARTYPVEDALVLAVDDPAGHTHGTFRLSVGPDGPSCERVEDDPERADLHLSIESLSTAWLGAVRATQLLAARRLVEHRPGAAARFDRLMGVEACPWTPFEF